jgi:hypothetical protein
MTKIIPLASASTLAATLGTRSLNQAAHGCSMAGCDKRFDRPFSADGLRNVSQKLFSAQTQGTPPD